MYEAVQRVFDTSDIVVKAAAVADYRPAEAATSKIKKRGDTMTLDLVKTTDILESLGRQKTTQFLIGFAAETDTVEQFARES